MAAARQKEMKLRRTVVATNTLTVGRFRLRVDEAMANKGLSNFTHEPDENGLYPCNSFRIVEKALKG